LHPIALLILVPPNPCFHTSQCVAPFCFFATYGTGPPFVAPPHPFRSPTRIFHPIISLLT
jgi:hypothetical protein